MDFFEHQDNARKKTGQLVLLFCLGLIATLAAVNLVCFLGYWMFYTPEATNYATPQVEVPAFLKGLFDGGNVQYSQTKSSFFIIWQSWWGSNLNWQVSVGVLAAVVIGTAFRYFELAGGGRKVAEWAGAKPVDMCTRDSDKKQFINVCEEMAIAAGMPVPELYVMEREQGINAFVAGYDSDEAVLVVTQGALDKLNRDQIQGVIGHEYSHILNGDMRLNIRLMSFLAGLIMIGQIGRFLIEANVGRQRSFTRSRANGKGAFAFVGAGIVFAAVGYVGVLIGRMIKAAVSRQREFLADASSVQFTRNPEGLAGALYEISVHNQGSQLQHRHAEDMSHFCFGESVALSDKLATHPPVNERIRRINPNFIAKERTRRRQTESAEESVGRSRPQAFDTAMAVAGITAMVGQVTPDHVSYAQGLYQHIPEQVKNWAHQSVGARAYLYCQVLLGSDDHQQKVLNAIKAQDSEVVGTLQKMWPYCQQMDEQLRLPVLELTIPTLRRMPEVDRVVLLDRLEQLVALDGRVDFIEWITVTLVKLRIRPKINQRHNQKLDNKVERYFDVLRPIFNVLVEVNPDKPAAEKVNREICTRIGMAYEPNRSLNEVGYDKLDQAMVMLDGISFMWRKVILQACADIIQSDGKVAFREYEILRVIAECLECPLPPLMIDLDESDPRDQAIPFH